MYGLPNNTDLSFLKEKELLQVCIGLNDLILNFDEPVTITITSECRYEHNEKLTVIDSYPLAASLICALIGKKIIGGSSEEGKHLRLRFDDGSSLIVYDDDEHYESYIIKGSPSGEIIV